MIVVVATTPERVGAAGDDLRSLGLCAPEVVAPTATRRLLLSPVPDQATGHRAVTALRKKGYPAVLRPPSGSQLESWIRHTEPVTVADRLTVAFAWSEHDRSHRPNVVEIDPEGGFGSGQHPATRLILEALATRVAGGERVLDVGCGNGILGLAALRLGGTHLVAIDIAPDAVTATRRNAELNGLTDLVDARSVPLDQIGQGPFDVVLANIGRAALVDLGPALAARVAPDGWLGVSGFSPPQCDVVAAALHPLSLIDTQVTGEWAALTLGRRGAPSP